MKRVLGITMGVCSSAALYVEGSIVACVSEERFLKKKNYDGYPKHAIEFCLRYGGISPEELDCVAMASTRCDPEYILTHHESDRTIKDWVREMHEYWRPLLYGEGEQRSYVSVFKDKIDLDQYPPEFAAFPFDAGDKISLFTEFRRRLVADHLGIPVEKIVMVEHHLSHACYGLLGSPERKRDALVFTADGFGDHSNASIRRFRNGQFELLYETDQCNIGRLYRYITLLLGMKPGEHEYKVMGLAPYAHPRNYTDVLAILNETLYVDGVEFKYRTRPTDHYFWFQERFEGMRFDAIAGGVQKYVETLLMQWVTNAIRAYGTSDVAFSGGVSMNIKINKEILSDPEVSYLSVPGSGGDESLAIGAIFGSLLMAGVPVDEIAPFTSLYLGDAIGIDEIEEFITSETLSERYTITRNTTSMDVAKLLAQGEIIGRFAGRMEFGQRALGNRSIIANPAKPGVVKTINEIIKQRDFWMPFAPTILYEDCDRYLENPKGIYSPFMTIGFDTKAAAHTDLAAALHPADLTVRPQMLKREINPGYYDIISEFKNMTGIGGVLNTSFNLHGLPIVQSLSDALHVMENSQMRFFLVENVLFEKRRVK